MGAKFPNKGAGLLIYISLYLVTIVRKLDFPWMGGLVLPDKGDVVPPLVKAFDQ